MEANWFQSPLAADAVLKEPLRRAAGSQLVLGNTVRSLLVRRYLMAEELERLTVAQVGVLDLLNLLSRVDAELALESGSVKTSTGTAKTGGLNAPQLTYETTRLMVRAVGQVLRRSTGIEQLADPQAMAQALGKAVGRSLAYDLFPPLAQPDNNKRLRDLLGEILEERKVKGATLEPINLMERQWAAQRIEARFSFMRTVVPSNRIENFERLMAVTCDLLKRTPPLDAAQFNTLLPVD